MLINFLVTIIGTLLLLLIGLLNNRFDLVHHDVLVILYAPYFLFGLILYLKTSIDGALLMARFVKRSATKDEASVAITATTVVNFIAILVIGIVYLLISDAPILTILIIIPASTFLIYLGVVEIQHLMSHDEDEEENGNFAELSKLAVFWAAAREISLLYFDGAAANLELLSDQNFLSISFALIFGQLALSTIVLYRLELVKVLADNTIFKVIGILAFLGLGLFGYYESYEKFIELI